MECTQETAYNSLYIAETVFVWLRLFNPQTNDLTFNNINCSNSVGYSCEVKFTSEGHRGLPLRTLPTESSLVPAFFCGDEKDHNFSTPELHVYSILPFMSLVVILATIQNEVSPA